MRQILLQGHRGARGLLAENTLPSLVKPFEYSIDGIEFDVQLSKDNQIVIYHDLQLNPSITRTPSSQWLKKPGPPIRSLSLKQLKKYKLGKLNKTSPYGLKFRRQKPCIDQTIPTLAELVEYLDKYNLNNVLLNIEIKHSPLYPLLCPKPETLAKSIANQIHALNISGRCIVQCFNWSVIKAIKELDDRLPISCLTTINFKVNTLSPYQGKASPWNAGLDIRDFGGSVPDMVNIFGADYWSPDYRNLTKPELCLAHEKKLKVMTWTVNHSATIKRLLEWGIDGLISDYPDKLANIWNQCKSKTGK